MKNSQIARRLAEDLLESLRPRIRINPEVSEDDILAAMEIHILRAHVDIDGNMHDSDDDR